MVNIAFCCRQGYHFSGISGNLEMSGNSAEVSEKPEKGLRSGRVVTVYSV